MSMSKEDKAYERWMNRAAVAVRRLVHLTDLRHAETGVLYALSVKAKNEDHTAWLVVGRQASQAGWEVAFHEAGSPDDALVGFVERMHSGDLKWHPDKYAYKED